ncbi:MAG: CerR family C-terminal domain-containing protein [Vicinamibacterales bacterium]
MTRRGTGTTPDQAPRRGEKGATPDRAPGERTRARLLEAATRQFAEQGLRRVTVRAICREAHANVAAVNYHFGDKLGLYRAVLDAAFEVLQETTRLAVEAGRGLSPEDQLRAYIKVHCERIFALRAPNALHALLQREMNEPTPALEPVMDRRLRPRFEYLFAVVGALIGRPASDPRVVMSAMSIHGLIVLFRPNPLSERLGRQMKIALTPDQATEHVLTFALAGLGPYSTSKAPGGRPRK